MNRTVQGWDARSLTRAVLGRYTNAESDQQPLAVNRADLEGAGAHDRMMQRGDGSTVAFEPAVLLLLLELSDRIEVLERTARR